MISWILNGNLNKLAFCWIKSHSSLDLI